MTTYFDIIWTNLIRSFERDIHFSFYGNCIVWNNPSSVWADGQLFSLCNRYNALTLTFNHCCYVDVQLGETSSRGETDPKAGDVTTGDANVKSNAPLDADESDTDVDELPSKSTDARDVEIEETVSEMSCSFVAQMSFSNSLSCCMKLRFGEMTPRRDRTRSNASSSVILFLYMTYAIQTVAERLTPAWQCTSTLPSLSRALSETHNTYRVNIYSV